VKIDGLDAAAVDDDLAAAHRWLRVSIGRMQKPAAAEHNAGHCAGSTAQEISAGCHWFLSFDGWLSRRGRRLFAS
jgi:hypothetical protein